MGARARVWVVAAVRLETKSCEKRTAAASLLHAAAAVGCSESLACTFPGAGGGWGEMINGRVCEKDQRVPAVAA